MPLACWTLGRMRHPGRGNMGRKALPGIEAFVSLVTKLGKVPKRELDAEMAKYERRKAAKKAKRPKPKRSGR